MCEKKKVIIITRLLSVAYYYYMGTYVRIIIVRRITDGISLIFQINYRKRNDKSVDFCDRVLCRGKKKNDNNNKDFSSTVDYREN